MLTLTRDYAAQARTASGVNILLGIWLIVSPWMVHYSAMGLPAKLNGVIVGAVIAALAVIRLGSWRETARLSWVNLVLALWSIASPWVYGYSANVDAVWSNVIVGVLIAALAILSAGATIAEQKHPPGAPSH
jgi:SPW repeat